MEATPAYARAVTPAVTSEIVVIGPVGGIAMTDSTEWAGPVSGTIDLDGDIDMGK